MRTAISPRLAISNLVTVMRRYPTITKMSSRRFAPLTTMIAGVGAMAMAWQLPLGHAALFAPEQWGSLRRTSPRLPGCRLPGPGASEVMRLQPHYVGVWASSCTWVRRTISPFPQNVRQGLPERRDGGASPSPMHGGPAVSRQRNFAYQMRLIIVTPK